MKEWLYKYWKKIRKHYRMIEASRKVRDTSTSNVFNSYGNLENINKYSEFKPSQIPSEITQLTDLVNTLKPKVICEIGSYKGGTLHLFSQAAPSDTLIISIDIDYPIERKLAHKNLVKAPQRLVCLKGNTQDPRTISRVMNVLKKRKIDFLFIDGDHSLFGVMNDYVRFYPLVKKSGVIAFHDINPDEFIKTGEQSSSYVGGVPQFWELIKKSNDHCVELIDNPVQDGFGIGLVYKSIE